VAEATKKGLGWRWARAFIAALAAKKQVDHDLMRLTRYTAEFDDLVAWASHDGPPMAVKAVKDARIAHLKILRGVENLDSELIRVAHEEMKDAAAVLREHVEA
jgi:hypothetical protein